MLACAQMVKLVSLSASFVAMEKEFDLTVRSPFPSVSVPAERYC